MLRQAIERSEHRRLALECEIHRIEGLVKQCAPKAPSASRKQSGASQIKRAAALIADMDEASLRKLLEQAEQAKPAKPAKEQAS